MVPESAATGGETQTHVPGKFNFPAPAPGTVVETEREQTRSHCALGRGLAEGSEALAPQPCSSSGLPFSTEKRAI